MRKLATLRTIESITPIENSDHLAVAKMKNLGWEVVVAKSEYAVGDRVIYFEIDSALPILSPFEFLRSRCYKAFKSGDKVVFECYRLKTIKLRGIISQGLVIHAGKLDICAEIYDDGEDFTTSLLVEHYDEVNERYNPLRLGGADSAGSFPSFVPKTDEERIQNLVDYFETKKDVYYEVTEKADGSSMTVIFDRQNFPDDPFQICSRNLRLKKNTDSKWMAPLLELGLEQKMAAYCDHHNVSLAIQGELVGPGINGNRDQNSKYRFLVFRVWDITEQEFLSPDRRLMLCAVLGLEHVLILGRWKIFEDLDTLPKMLEFTEGKTDNGNEREGVVFKGDDGSHFKCINNNYLLKGK